MSISIKRKPAVPAVPQKRGPFSQSEIDAILKRADAGDGDCKLVLPTLQVNIALELVAPGLSTPGEVHPSRGRLLALRRLGAIGRVRAGAR
jgi:hypothetical protein